MDDYNNVHRYVQGNLRPVERRYTAHTHTTKIFRKTHQCIIPELSYFMNSQLQT